MRLFIICLIATFAFACKNEEKAAPKAAAPAEKAAAAEKAPEKKEAPAEKAAAKDPAAKKVEGVSDDGKVVTVALTGSDQMKYNLSEIKVAAGRTVKLTLTHSGKMPATAMGHNFVLLKAGTDVTAFATKATNAKDAGFIPDSEKGSIIAHTKLIGGGESDTIEFAAPAAGTYDYICTFPGHFALMKGKLIVE
jgi:azurin